MDRGKHDGFLAGPKHITISIHSSQIRIDFCLEQQGSRLRNGSPCRPRLGVDNYDVTRPELVSFDVLLDFVGQPLSLVRGCVECSKLDEVRAGRMVSEKTRTRLGSSF